MFLFKGRHLLTFRPLLSQFSGCILFQKNWRVFTAFYKKYSIVIKVSNYGTRRTHILFRALKFV